MCEIKVIYLGPTPFLRNVTLCEQHRLVNANPDSG